MNWEKLAKAFIREVKERSQVFLAFIYGSAARREFDARHSDIDILILLFKKKVKREERDEILELAEDFCLGRDHRADLIHPEVPGFNEIGSSLFRSVLEGGKLLYNELKVSVLYSFSTSEMSRNKRADFHRKLFGGTSTYKTKEGKVKKKYQGLLEKLKGKRKVAPL